MPGPQVSHRRALAERCRAEVNTEKTHCGKTSVVRLFFVTFWQKAALDVFRGQRTVYSQLTRRGDKPRAGNQQRRNRT